VPAPGSAKHVIIHGLYAQFYALYRKAADQIQCAGINAIRPSGKTDAVQLALANPFRCSGQQVSDPFPRQPEEIAAEESDFNRSLAAASETKKFFHLRKSVPRSRVNFSMARDQVLVAEDAPVWTSGMRDEDRHDEMSLVHGAVARWPLDWR
jgi:hypothetical protein